MTFETLKVVQLIILVLWPLAAFGLGLTAIEQFRRTGRSASILVILSVALAGSFMYFFLPKLTGEYRTYATFGSYLALVVAMTALLLPLLSRWAK